MFRIGRILYLKQGLSQGSDHDELGNRIHSETSLFFRDLSSDSNFSMSAISCLTVIASISASGNAPDRAFSMKSSALFWFHSAKILDKVF